MSAEGKIYTRSGDDGTTGLRGNVRVGKDDPRLDVYGTIDELNSHLGLIRTLAEHEKLPDLAARIAQIQNEMFSIGSELATPPGAGIPATNCIQAGQISRLENWIDEMNAATPPLHSFILPGGTIINAQLHVARTVCRRAERRLVDFSRHEKVSPLLIVYLNRLSDLLFTMARFDSHSKGAAEYKAVAKSNVA